MCFSVLVKVLTNTCGVQAVLCWGCPIKIHCVKGVKRPCMVTCQAFVCVVGIVCVSTCGLVCLQSARHAVTGSSVVSECGARGRSSSVHEGLHQSFCLATKCSNQDGRRAGNEGVGQ